VLVLLSHVFSKMAQNHKTTTKNTTKHQTVENHALEEFLCGFCGFWGSPQIRPPDPDPYPNRPTPVRPCLFLYIYISNTPKTTIKITKPLKIKGLGF